MGSPIIVGICADILDSLIKTDLSGQEIRTVLAVIKRHPVSLHEITSLLGYSKARCSQIIKKLVFMKIITVDENINGVRKTLTLNVNVNEWATVYPNINLISKHKQSGVVEVKNFKTLS